MNWLLTVAVGCLFWLAWQSIRWTEGSEMKTINQQLDGIRLADEAIAAELVKLNATTAAAVVALDSIAKSFRVFTGEDEVVGIGVTKSPSSS